MIANLFSIGDRNYLNNAVVIADALETITGLYGDVKDFKIQFRKPFLSQGDLQFSLTKLDGYIVGQFKTENDLVYFSYTPTGIELQNVAASREDIISKITAFNVCYYITDICRGVIEVGFEKIYGPMSPNDKVIFVIFEVPDTSVFTSIISSQLLPAMRITEAEQTGDRRFKVSVYVGDRLLGHRHSTVKEFNL